MVNLTINHKKVQVKEGTSILEAAAAAGIRIPTLCYLKEINEIGACRICVVEVKGARSLVTACVYPVNEGGRGDGGLYQQRKGDSCQKNECGVYFIQTQHKLHILCQKWKLFASDTGE